MLVDSEAKNWIVLIVDDEPDNVQVAAKILSFLGAAVHTADNGKSGLAILNDLTPTFILLDLSMPTMDGWDMLTHIRAMPHLAKTAVIALTAHAMSGDKERALGAGFDCYIPKPFHIQTLLADIKACLCTTTEDCEPTAIST